MSQHSRPRQLKDDDRQGRPSHSERDHGEDNVRPFSAVLEKSHAAYGVSPLGFRMVRENSGRICADAQDYHRECHIDGREPEGEHEKYPRVPLTSLQLPVLKQVLSVVYSH